MTPVGEGVRAPVIDVPYLLTLNIPLIRDSDGRYFADASWAKDLMLHTEYLPELTLVCPYRCETPPAAWSVVAAPGLTISGYRTTARGIGQYLAIGGLALRLLATVPRARIVHTGIAGFPIPTGWLAVPLARLLGKQVVIPVESAFWRLPHGVDAGRGARIKARVWEGINRFCMRQATYASYSQQAYRDSLPSPRAGGGELFQASWIDDEVVLSAAAIALRRRGRDAGRGRFLFATRMIPEKGTGVMAGALAMLAARGGDLDVDIIGEGHDLPRLAAAVDATDWAASHVRILDPVPYGPDFFALLGAYDAIIVPSLSDEQPRIVYDAASQGVPAIAADTAGTRACVRDGETGTLVPPGDPAALAAALETAAANLPALHAMGLAGRDLAARHTHRGMHRQRAEGLRHMLDRTSP